MKKSIYIAINVVLGAILFTLSSYISFDAPGSSIPITLQSLVILSYCFVHQNPIGFLSVLLYLVLGAVGLPVFADGNAGLEIFFGNTGGYLIGFLCASLFMGEWHKMQWPLKINTALLAMLLGTLIVLLCGYLKLSTSIGLQAAYIHGIAPFIPGAIFKIIAGAYISLVICRFTKGVSPKS